MDTDRFKGKGTSCVFYLLLVLSVAPGFSAEVTTSTTSAVAPRALLEASVLAMGGSVPVTSVATGTVTITAGSEVRGGTIQTLTRGFVETNETIDTANRHEECVYARGRAAEKQGASRRRLQMELAVTSQSANFPLVLIANALNDPETAYEYVGADTADGQPAHHLRTWKTFASLCLPSRNL